MACIPSCVWTPSDTGTIIHLVPGCVSSSVLGVMSIADFVEDGGDEVEEPANMISHRTLRTTNSCQEDRDTEVRCIGPGPDRGLS